MKFGRNLHEYQVVEWDAFYVDYKFLKKLHKLATKIAVDRAEEADFTGLAPKVPYVPIVTRTQSSQLSWSAI